MRTRNAAVNLDTAANDTVAAMPPSPARYTIAVGSGKGGVGKSTISLNLALALKERGAAVGLIDADVYGPDIPRMLNLARRQWLKEWTLWQSPQFAGPKLEPIDAYGVKVMSTGFLVAEDQPLAWEAQMIDLALHQLIHDVEWGALDYLVIDLPPGTADLQQRLMSKVDLTGAIVVVTPQDVAHLDARKLVSMYRAAGVPILGGVQNMDGLICPDCGERIDVFPSVRDDRSIWAMGIEAIGGIPMHPAIAEATDRGKPVFAESPASPQAGAFRTIAANAASRCEAQLR